MIHTNNLLATSFPAQMLSYKDKVKNKRQWGKDCMDTCETLARRQYLQNIRFAENYQMLNGKFIQHHYFETDGPADWLTALTEEFEMPSTLRHYDIIGKVINNLTEKLAEFPDVFRVEEKFEDDDGNEYVRTQTRLMHDSIKATVNAEINAQLLAQGVDIEKNDFASEEEAMQYYEEVQQLTQAMEPSKIDTYMKTSWQSQGEIWGTHQMALDKERFKTPELERKEFKDMLITDRCFRHFYLTGDGYMQETWNPMNTFFQISPDIDWVQDGDYVGRITYMSRADIFERFGWKMKDKDIRLLEDMDENQDTGNDLSGFPYKVYAPFEDYKTYSQIVKNTGFDPIQNIPEMGDDRLMELSGNRMPFIDNGLGLYRVTEAYWRSQRQVGKVVYIDEETGQLVMEMVDENYILPEGFKSKKGDFVSGKIPNTVYWTWVNQVWKGTKISSSFSDQEAIYLDLEPCEFQFKGDYNVFGAKLPVCGRIFNDRNAQSMALVDLMKPHQIGYNVCMNQIYQLLEKEIGKFMVWDANFFNTMKDWGGEDSWEKISILAKELGHVMGDTSPINMKGANSGNQLPKMIDLELTSQMFSRAKLADFFEAKAMSQVGVNPQMMAEVGQNETATGVKTAVVQSQLNVQKYYTDFFEYKQRCLTMDLEIAQFVQSNKQDITVMYTKSDGSREFIHTTGTELLLKNLHTYVLNSQELLRQMEATRQWFLSNNQNVSGLDVLEVIKSNSPAEMKLRLQEAEDRKMEFQNQQLQQNQQQMQQAGEIAQMKEEKLDARNTENNETKKEVAYIATFNRQSNNLGDTNVSGVPDVLEYQKLSSQNKANDDKLAISKEANNIKRQQNAMNNNLKNKELSLKEQQLKQKAKEIKADRYIAKINKN